MHQEHFHGAALLAIQQQAGTFLGHNGDPHQKRVSIWRDGRVTPCPPGKGLGTSNDLPKIRTPKSRENFRPEIIFRLLFSSVACLLLCGLRFFSQKLSQLGLRSAVKIGVLVHYMYLTQSNGYTPDSPDKTSGRCVVCAESYGHSFRMLAGGVTGPSLCTTTNEKVYITARACELEFGGTAGLQAAGAGGL
jgi:hypothetical protein